MKNDRNVEAYAFVVDEEIDTSDMDESVDASEQSPGPLLAYKDEDGNIRDDDLYLDADFIPEELKKILRATHPPYSAKGSEKKKIKLSKKQKSRMRRALKE